LDTFLTVSVIRIITYNKLNLLIFSCIAWVKGYGVERRFQQYFSYIRGCQFY